MTRLSVAHGAINLSQGFPDFPAPEEIKEAARAAIADDINQYPITWGAEPFRAAIAETYRSRYGLTWVEAERDVTVTCGSTEAMIAAMLARARPGGRGRRVRAVLREQWAFLIGCCLEVDGCAQAGRDLRSHLE